MISLEIIKSHHLFEKGRKLFPATAFLGGFTWDSITLGKIVKATDLYLLSLYFVALFGITAYGGFKSESPFWQKHKNHFNWAMQFCFGAVFSALVIFYFKSSGHFMSYLVVFGLILLLIANEFLANQYQRFTLTWALFGISTSMYLTFVLPHIFQSASAWWFYLSCFIGLSLIILFRKKFGSKGSIKPTVFAHVILLLFFLLQWLPPVPFALKQSLFCKSFSKTKGEYTCKQNDSGLFSLTQTLHYKQGEKIYFLSSVFAPTKVKSKLEHRWWFYDKTKGEWILKDTIAFPMKGGRENGWRTYSFKRSVSEGEWKVETALAKGPVMGTHHVVLQKGFDPTYKVNLK